VTQRGRRFLALCALACACGAPRNDPPDAGGDASEDAGKADAGPQPTADEARLRALIERASPVREDVEAALLEVARSDGLPAQTAAGTFLFACACGDGAWTLAGDFNAWTGETMARNGALSWTERAVTSPDGARYKFHDGVDAWVADPWARRYHYDEFGEISYVRANAGHLERWPGVASHGLVPRTVRVWVPPGRDFERALYVHDGQNVFDPEGPTGSWRLHEAPPARTLVVAIDNTENRFYEYTHVQDKLGLFASGGGGDAYADFVELTVRPLIEAEYGTSAVRGVLGISLGGLISLHIAARYPGAYRFAGSMSGTLGWGRIELANETIIERYRAAGHRSTAIYLDSGGGADDCRDDDLDGISDDDPTARDNYCETVQMRDTLSDLGYAFEVDLWHWHEPDAGHSWEAWRARLFRPLGVFAALE
jgi:hypothetical protein